MAIANIEFLVKNKVIVLKGNEFFFTKTFIDKVILPNKPNIDNILTASAEHLLKSNASVDLDTSLSIISALLTENGVEDVEEKMNLFA